MTDIITWEDPPPKTSPGRPSRYAPLVAALEERPGQWARMPQGHTQDGARNAQTRLRKMYPHVEWRIGQVDDLFYMYGRIPTS